MPSCYSELGGGKLKPADAAMERYAAGDDEAFGEVYDHVAPRLYGFLWRQVRDATRVEDLVQQTMLHMHRARGTFIRGAEVLPWAFAISRRLLIDSRRRERTDVLASHALEEQAAAVPSTSDSAEDLVRARQAEIAVERELSRLPESQRIAFELVKREGLSFAEAAQVLGTTVMAVKMRAHRASEAVRLVLGGAKE